MSEILEQLAQSESTGRTIPIGESHINFPYMPSCSLSSLSQQGTSTLRDLFPPISNQPHVHIIYFSQDTDDSYWVSWTNALIILDEMPENNVVNPLNACFTSRETTQSRYLQADVAPSGVTIPSTTDECGLPTQPQASKFCENHNLEEATNLAINLINDAFQSAKNLNLQTEQDPETSEEWLVIDFTLEGEISQIIKEHENFTRKWAASAPEDKKNLVRIEFNILS